MTNAEGLIHHPTRFLLFTGKGGVGKTSLACAAAVALADRGKQVLLVSTDPASNLDEVLETRLGSQPTLHIMSSKKTGFLGPSCCGPSPGSGCCG